MWPVIYRQADERTSMPLTCICSLNFDQLQRDIISKSPSLRWPNHEKCAIVMPKPLYWHQIKVSGLSIIVRTMISSLLVCRLMTSTSLFLSIRMFVVIRYLTTNRTAALKRNPLRFNTPISRHQEYSHCCMFPCQRALNLLRCLSWLAPTDWMTTPSQQIYSSISAYFRFQNTTGGREPAIDTSRSLIRIRHPSPKYF